MAPMQSFRTCQCLWTVHTSVDERACVCDTVYNIQITYLYYIYNIHKCFIFILPVFRYYTDLLCIFYIHCTYTVHIFYPYVVHIACTNIHACIHRYAYVRTYVCMNLCVCMYVCTYVCLSVYLPACLSVCLYIHMLHIIARSSEVVLIHVFVQCHEVSNDSEPEPKVKQWKRPQRRHLRVLGDERRRSPSQVPGRLLEGNEVGRRRRPFRTTLRARNHAGRGEKPSLDGKKWRLLLGDLIWWDIRI
jgi:hypothetical protein